MRLTAQTKAQKLSEKVLKKYLKSRAIGSVTGRKRLNIVCTNACDACYSRAERGQKVLFPFNLYQYGICTYIYVIIVIYFYF